MQRYSKFPFSMLTLVDDYTSAEARRYCPAALIPAGRKVGCTDRLGHSEFYAIPHLMLPKLMYA